MKSIANVRALVVHLALASSIAACATGTAADTPSPVATTAPTGTQAPDLTLDRTFRSALYGYTITYPAAFGPRSATEFLKGAAAPLIDGEMVDQLTGPDGEVIVLAATDLAAGTTLDAWTAITALAFCGDSTTSEAVRLDGEPATLSTFARCGGMFHQWVTAVHAGRGYHVIWANGPGTEPGDRTLFIAMLGTFSFGRD